MSNYEIMFVSIMVLNKYNVYTINNVSLNRIIQWQNFVPIDLFLLAYCNTKSELVTMSVMS